MKRSLICVALATVLLQPAAWAAAASASLPLAGDQLFALPPEAQARRALTSLPELRIGSINQELANAERDRLRAGPHEWVATAGLARRNVVGGTRLRENEVGVQRTLRWFGKADLDRAIGDKGMLLAESQRADIWHEASRGLMRDWYAALTAQASLQRLQDQHALVLRLKQVAERRVKAGDAAALEVMQADTELRRSAALLEQSRLDLVQATNLLAITYAGLALPDAAGLPEPRALEGDSEVSLTRLLGDNHELELAEVEADWESLRARRVAKERMPDPTVGVRVAREQGGDERVLGLTLSIPLPGALRSAESRAAALRASVAREQLAQTRQRVQVEAQRVLAEQAHRYRLWTALRDVATQSARQSELMERAYQAGEGSLSDALNSRRLALEAALSAQGAQIAALAAAARVELDAHALWRPE